MGIFLGVEPCLFFLSSQGPTVLTCVPQVLLAGAASQPQATLFSVCLSTAPTAQPVSAFLLGAHAAHAGRGVVGSHIVLLDTSVFLSYACLTAIAHSF